jgi:hypothetical protein
MKHHGKENRTKHNGEGELNIYTIENLLSFTSHINDISSEIKALQRSTTKFKEEMPQFIRSELIRLKGDFY